MKLASKMSKQLAALLMAMMMVGTPYMTMAEETKLENQEVRLQDDFYVAVNKDWLASTTLKPGYTSMNTFMEVNDKCQEQIQELFAEILNNEKRYNSTDSEKNMINLYKNYLNKEARNKQGIEPIKPYLEKIKGIKSMEDLDAYLMDIIQGNIAGLYSLGVDADLKDSDRKAFYLNPTSLILGDSDYYNKPNEQAKKMESATTNYLNKMLVLVGYSKEEAEKKVQEAYAFEKKLTPHIIGQEEVTLTSNIYEKLYNVYTLDELDKLAPKVKLQEKLQKNFGDKVTKVIVTEPEWLKVFNELYTNDSLEEIKNYIEIKYLCNVVGNLSDDFEKIAEEYTKELTGVEGSVPKDQEAMMIISSVFSNEIGQLYVEKYFSEEAKQDVKELVEEIIAAYKKKLQAVDWMTEETKQNAIQKLDAIKIKVGYPDKWDKFEGLELKSYEEGGSLFENELSLMKWSYDKGIEELNKPIDKTVFVMSPQTVNACYNATCNDITFPAGILQAPFYDLKRSKEENLGSIGAIIAHEISHAFDTNGANFDKDGNVKEWWTKEDYAKFEEKAKTVRSYYSNVATDSGAKVNGDLTVGENIADITGMACVLDIMKEMDHPDYKAFFESWARSWREIATPEVAALNLERDVHSPNKVRANTVVSQFQEFYDAYGIKEGDGMYVKPEDRLKVY